MLHKTYRYNDGTSSP